LEGVYLVEAGGVAEKEDAVVAVVAAGEAEEARARVDAGVEGAGRGDVLREGAGAAAEVEDGLAGLQGEEVENGGDRGVAVVLPAALAGPADVPVGDGVPTPAGAEVLRA